MTVVLDIPSAPTDPTEFAAMAYGPPSMSEIVKGQLYLGNLSAALSPPHRARTTHLLSVCPDYPSTGPAHLAISVDDSEYDDLLVHLPTACKFIEDAIKGGGSVLVHCVMGVSRSATVVAAYLMQTQHLPSSSALAFIKSRRPQISPNYGFLTQLDAFARCAYAPGPESQVYRSWKRRQEQDVTAFLNCMVDSVVVVDGIRVSSDFPDDPHQATSLLLDLGITHLVSITPASSGCFSASPTPSSSSTPTPISALPLHPTLKHHHIALPPPSVSLHSNPLLPLLLALPGASAFIRGALEEETADEGKGHAQVLVHCEAESRACVVACAAVMQMQKKTPDEAFALIEDALPLFNPTQTFLRPLELFHACNYRPTKDHPAVRAWMGPAPPPPPVTIHTEEEHRVDAYEPVTTTRIVSLSPSRSASTQDPAPSAARPEELHRTAAHVLADTGLDASAFGKALRAIQAGAVGAQEGRKQGRSGEGKEREGEGWEVGHVERVENVAKGVQEVAETKEVREAREAVWSMQVQEARDAEREVREADRERERALPEEIVGLAG